MYAFSLHGNIFPEIQLQFIEVFIDKIHSPIWGLVFVAKPKLSTTPIPKRVGQVVLSVNKNRTQTFVMNWSYTQKCSAALVVITFMKSCVHKVVND